MKQFDWVMKAIPENFHHWLSQIASDIYHDKHNEHIFKALLHTAHNLIDRYNISVHQVGGNLHIYTKKMLVADYYIVHRNGTSLVVAIWDIHRGFIFFVVDSIPGVSRPVFITALGPEMTSQGMVGTYAEALFANHKFHGTGSRAKQAWRRAYVSSNTVS